MAALPNTFNSTNERDANGANSRLHWVYPPPAAQWPNRHDRSYISQTDRLGAQG